MHIEPGVLDAVKVTAANGAALATLAVYSPALVRQPVELVKAVFAALFFSVFMEIYHLPVGPSELHFIGASAVYFTFGFLPTLFGFAVGLLLQGALFEPQDLLHLGVNSLSLIVPLVAVHETVGKRFFAEGVAKTAVTWGRIMAFDAAYYAGVVAMVGFWLFWGEEATPLADWALFAASYLPLVLCEPVFTFVALKGVNRLTAASPLRRVTALDRLALA
ncbi:energy-coupling factor ABC transporter permease [Azospirillum griseum]|uniref:Cobalamin biosynthesis protein CbiM n=1 Tax=Azospirillum griseum TaxID=2496639 RepID=A0A431VHT3_9PROT|nr:energy-coupling factor ABC transporter permease [Azospirillum griseum]RTR20208.1 cobalamin biosynthesis protein CbiM [Azospirillum griseum]